MDNGRRTTTRLDGLKVDAQALDRAADEGPAGQLVAQGRVRFEAGLGPDHLAVAVNLGRKRLRAVGGGAGLEKKFEPAAVVDVELALDGVPQVLAGLPQLSGRFGRLRGGRATRSPMRSRVSLS